MFLYQYTIITLMLTLLFNKASRAGAFYVLVSYALYYLFFDAVDGIYYYSLSAAVCYLCGIMLEDKNKVAAMCSYLLIPVNAIGFLIWSAYYPPLVYNFISMILLVIQAVSIIPRGRSNGLRCYFKYLMASSHGFNGTQQSATITKTKEKD